MKHKILIGLTAVIVVVLAAASISSYHHYKVQRDARNAVVAQQSAKAAQASTVAQKAELSSLQAQAAHFRAACLGLAAKTKQSANLCN